MSNNILLPFTPDNSILGGITQNLGRLKKCYNIKNIYFMLDPHESYDVRKNIDDKTYGVVNTKNFKAPLFDAIDYFIKYLYNNYTINYQTLVIIITDIYQYDSGDICVTEFKFVQYGVGEINGNSI